MKDNAMDTRIAFVLTKADKKLLEDAAEFAGLTVSDLIRTTVYPLAQAVVSRDPKNLFAVTDGLGALWHGLMSIKNASAYQTDGETI